MNIIYCYSVPRLTPGPRMSGSLDGTSRCKVLPNSNMAAAFKEDSLVHQGFGVGPSGKWSIVARQQAKCNYMSNIDTYKNNITYIYREYIYIQNIYIYRFVDLLIYHPPSFALIHHRHWRLRRRRRPMLRRMRVFGMGIFGGSFKKRYGNHG